MSEHKFTGVNRYTLSCGGLGSMGEFTRLEGLGVQVEVFEYAEGGHNDTCWYLPGRVRCENLVLSRGMTKGVTFLTWFWKSRNSPDEVSEVTVTLKSPDNANDMSIWTVQGAYPVRWSGPVLDASGASIAQETVEIAHTGLVPVEG